MTNSSEPRTQKNDTRPTPARGHVLGRELRTLSDVCGFPARREGFFGQKCCPIFHRGGPLLASTCCFRGTWGPEGRVRPVDRTLVCRDSCGGAKHRQVCAGPPAPSHGVSVERSATAAGSKGVGCELRWGAAFWPLAGEPALTSSPWGQRSRSPDTAVWI